MKKKKIVSLTAVVLLIVTFNIVKAEESAQEPESAEKNLQRVTELFNAYVHKQPGTEVDVSHLYGSVSIFKWEDIPSLLELAKKDNLLKGMPSLMISSYMGRYCREGMIALWFVEGIRRQQLSLEREKQLGEKMQMHIAYSRLPLNPICIKEGMQIEECEQSLEIHKTVLEVYNKWWQLVGSLPAPQAAAFYPFDRTNLSWYGSPNLWPDEPLEVYDKISPEGTAAQRTIRQLEKIKDSYEYEPGKILQTVYYSLKNPDDKPPFKPDMLKIQKIVLNYYNDKGKVIQTKDILPPH